MTLSGTIMDLVKENDRRLFAEEGASMEDDESEEGQRPPEDPEELALR